MRRFQFRLERFLELRRWKEREWEVTLARVLGECLLLENRIRDIGELIGESRLAVFQTGSRIDVQAMARRELYVQRLAAERERRKVTLAEKRVEQDRVRARYLEAAKERKVLDKLKERRSDEYYEHQLDEEYKGVDEINTGAHARLSAAAGLPSSSGAV